MTYNYLSEQLLSYDKMVKDYEQLANAHTEHEQEKRGFISGDINETHESLKYMLMDSRDNFGYVTQFLEEHCPNSFNIMIANLDSNSDKYETLYDLCSEINIRKEDNFEFPIDCLKKIQIYVD